MAGQTDHALRGDYAHIRADYTVDQNWLAYTQAEHDLWKRLYTRQVAHLPDYACAEFLASLGALNFSTGIPKFADVNPKLKAERIGKLLRYPACCRMIFFLAICRTVVSR